MHTETSEVYELLTEAPYIDKTEALEKGIVSFPAIYVEGAAASGKTTAVKMLLAGHPEIRKEILLMDEETTAEALEEKLQEMKELMKEKAVWAVFENMQNSSLEAEEITAAFIEDAANTSSGSKIILISRERPGFSFLKLLWKGQMELISMEMLRFTRGDVQHLVKTSGSLLNAMELFETSKGYPGCVRKLLELSCDTARLRNCPEMQNYMKTITASLSEAERKILEIAAVCPWINEELCMDIWEIPQPNETFKLLERKGMLISAGNPVYWKTEPLFKICFPTELPPHLLKKLGDWYNSKNCINEALNCLYEAGDKSAYRECVLEHFDKVPFLEHDWSAAAEWKEPVLQTAYLRGMNCFFRGDIKGLQQAILEAESADAAEKIRQEILLNLNFVNPDMPLEEWLKLLREFSADGRRFRLYSILGGSFTYLCGLRDLSGMFACSKKEESARARLWQKSLGDEEWQAFCQAKMAYYLETERWELIKEEEKSLLKQWGDAKSWQLRLGCLYLLSKLQKKTETQEYIRLLEESLNGESDSLCMRNTEAVKILAFEGSTERKTLARRLKEAEPELSVEIDEKNYIMYCSYARAYMLLNQYEKAEKILQKVLPYLHRYKRSRLLAELLFQQGIVYWGKEMYKEASQAVTESFSISREYRYVQFYFSYGKKGTQVLEAYIQWVKNNAPKGWHRKKKYKYGNILRMPYQDYLETLHRKAEQKINNNGEYLKKGKEEQLSMTEIIILQDMSMGLTDQEISDDLGLKLPTIRNYASALYKKMGVSNRVQAINKGKELGILG